MEKQEAILRLTNFADDIRNSEDARPTELKLIEAIDTLISEVNNSRLYGVVGNHSSEQVAVRIARIGARDITQSVLDGHFKESIEPVSMLISAMPKFPSEKSYIPESDFNAKKHEETCKRNRSKRRKKKRR